MEVRYKSGMITLKDKSALSIINGPFDQSEYNCTNIEDRGFNYGMFEIRCKIPNGKSDYWDVWPAFWLLSVETEIDIIDNITANPYKLV